MSEYSDEEIMSGIDIGGNDPDWLRNDWAKRQRISTIARTIDYYQACLNAVPYFPENRSTIESYLKGFDNACADMMEVLKDE